MSAVLLGIFNEYEAAERVRVELVRDGFPTDRVELTAGCEPGRAGLEPADSPHGRLVQYFRVLFMFDDERYHAEQLAKRVDNGAATITVHLRGSMETARATQILLNARAEQLLSHDLANQTPPCAVPKPAYAWLIGPLALCLLLAGYLVARHAFAELGLGVTRSELRLKQVPETVPDETKLPYAGYSPSRSLSAAIAQYFDTYLGPGELHLNPASDLYARVDDSDWWALRNGVADTASCFGAAFCGAYDVGRSPLPSHSLETSQQRWRDLNDKVLPL
jgi:hypothetical protein